MIPNGFHASGTTFARMQTDTRVIGGFQAFPPWGPPGEPFPAQNVEFPKEFQ